jgi:hypothetical protein
MVDGSTALSAVTTGPNSSTVASSKYGTVQSDGRMYYYTDIKGSKPIKDPRIGSHFGSQRHEIASIQLLEQETATHGSNVYSIDGRKWMRCTGGGWSWTNDGHGSRLKGGNVSSYANMYIEVVGYFNGINTLAYTDSNHKFRYTLDGGSEVATDFGNTTVATPLGSRFVDPGSLVNITSTATLGIHTIKLRSNGAEHDVHGIELIAQDTTSTATKSQIQIPSQNVVSYGKKFTISGTPHYNPFATKGDDSASTIPSNTTGDSVATGWTGSTSAYWDSSLDTATSLGLGAWVEGGAYYRPVNGGRIVKWVDSTGTIKTSVNMMPPSAKALGSHSGDATPTGATNWSTQYLPIFSTGAIDHSQTEVAKTYHFREFGNGNKNGGAIASGATGDLSMIKTGDQTCDAMYVMDDGLTSFNGDNVNLSGTNQGIHLPGATSYYVTFIGTGLSFKDLGGTHTGSDSFKFYIDSVEVKNFTSGYVYPNSFISVAQNLPYGTHIFRVERVAASDYGQRMEELSFHQPKKPPIPEDAVVIADYMLMADHVVRTNDGIQYISKGVRGLDASRDVYYDAAGAFTFDYSVSIPHAFSVYRDTESAVLSRITAFSTNAIKLSYNAAARYQAWYTNDTAHSSADTTTKNGASHASYYHPTAATTLGQNIYDQFGAGVSALQTQGYEIATPIHTSSHYQTFETPFLHELVGGDRNMEQTNLVVTPDGKTWDEVTRDVSYLGNTVLVQGIDSGHITISTDIVYDEARGLQDNVNLVQKDSWAIAYDRFVCLEDGWYLISLSVMTAGSGAAWLDLKHNDNTFSSMQTNVASDYGNLSQSKSIFCKRGDTVRARGDEIYGNQTHSHSFSIFKI